ncbi:MAG TPA: hypothetical protein VF392_13870 [Terracidiphilus sp.]
MPVVAIGVFCAGSTLYFYLAIKHTSAGNVAQYHYTQLISGTLVSLLIWHDTPSPSVIFGAH